MRPAGGAVRDRALHFRHAPRRLSRSSLAPAHQASALSPFIDNPRRNASSPATPLLTRGCPRSLPCLRLVAPVENRARLGFASLASRVLAQPRRSRVMVSSRAYSSPALQPASRHSIKPLFDARLFQVGRRVPTPPPFIGRVSNLKTMASHIQTLPARHIR